MKKTLWQKIYSFFGFWHYYETNSNGRYRVLFTMGKVLPKV